MDEAICPRCKTTKYRNPSMVLMVNTCGHTLCENCVETLFARGSGTCPECNVSLRRNTFRIQQFEDPFVDKEVDIRKRVLKIYNRQEEEFSGLREYNDYLEEVETIIFNLSNNVDVELTKKKVEEYQKSNKSNIQRNRSKLSKDDELMEQLIEEEQAYLQHSRHELVQQEKREKQRKMRQREELLDNLEFSDLPAGLVLASHTARQEEEIEKKPAQTIKFSTGIRIGGGTSFLPVPKAVEAALYQYRPGTVDILGPEPPQITLLEENGYMSHMRDSSEVDMAGGYTTKLGCHRALQEAFCGLYFVPDLTADSVGQEQDMEVE
ncbi:CDK-activating kinase assembly factor MAT1-like [Branchiostoma lanceolatum]|uniref:CDK-activating kinase assembly factor MAT1-like n=1 Tax=Branchiostoma lanceolatum TaxID=7740 RepID=UPI003454559C